MYINKIPYLCRYLTLLIFALFISACADDDNLDQPAELVPFYSKYYLDVSWHKSTGAGVEEQYIFLQPLILKDIAVTTSRDGVLNIISLETGDFEQDIELDSIISAGIGGNEEAWLLATRDAYVIAVDAKIELNAGVLECQVKYWQSLSFIKTRLLCEPLMAKFSVWI